MPKMGIETVSNADCTSNYNLFWQNYNVLAKSIQKIAPSLKVEMANGTFTALVDSISIRLRLVLYLDRVVVISLHVLNIHWKQSIHMVLCVVCGWLLNVFVVVIRGVDQGYDPVPNKRIRFISFQQIDSQNASHCCTPFVIVS